MVARRLLKAGRGRGPGFLERDDQRPCLGPERRDFRPKLRDGGLRLARRGRQVLGDVARRLADRRIDRVERSLAPAHDDGGLVGQLLD